MNKFYNLAVSSCICVFVSSCAYEPDRNRPARDGIANPQVKDVLKGKTNAEIINLKYDSLAMTCSLISEFETADEMSEFKMSEPPQSNPPSSPVTNDREKTVFDVKAQLAVDPTLKEEQKNAKMELDEGNRKLSAALRIKPVMFIESLNMKHDSSVYIMKHSPALTLAYSFTVAIDDRNSTTFEGLFKDPVHEGVPFKNLITTETLDGKKRSYFVICDFKGGIKKDNGNFADQWLRIDCSKPAEPGRENLHQKNCHGGKPIPDTI